MNMSGCLRQRGKEVLSQLDELFKRAQTDMWSERHSSLVLVQYARQADDLVRDFGIPVALLISCNWAVPLNSFSFSFVSPSAG